MRLLLLLMTACGMAGGESGDGQAYQFFSEQLIVIGTVVGAVAALPALVAFLVDWLKRRERIDLGLEDEQVAELTPRTAGFEELLAGNADLIDLAAHPYEYPLGASANEMLIIGPPMSGKKSLAARIACEARMQRLITVHNLRSVEVLAAAKARLRRSRSHQQRVMLLLPNIDRALERDDDDDLQAELDALVEAASELRNVLVVGTAARFAPDSELDNRFGIKLVVPGTRLGSSEPRQVPDEARPVLTAVTAFYIDRVLSSGVRLVGMQRGEVEAMVLAASGNPAEVEDIVTLCAVSAHHRARIGTSPSPEITPEIVRSAIARTVVQGQLG